MLYFFERGEERIAYEIRLAPDGSGYELVVSQPDGLESIERFPDLDQLRERERELMSLWASLGWTGGVSRR